MKRQIITTADGSKTIHLPDWKENYHSHNGAIQEANHVFIKMGLNHLCSLSEYDEISILEIGFGTGLNALVTWKALENSKRNVRYTAVEAYPVDLTEISALNYAEMIDPEMAKNIFNDMHKGAWGKPLEITHSFTLIKQQKFFQEIEDVAQFKLIYFDAFGAQVQPDLWTQEIFEKMFVALKLGGMLVTYSAKGSVRRNMQAVGFTVERLPGPPGKREMLRATKM